MAVPSHTSTGHVGGFPSLHTLSSIYRFILVILEWEWPASQGTLGRVWGCFGSSQWGWGQLLVAPKPPNDAQGRMIQPQGQRDWGWETLAPSWWSCPQLPCLPSCAPHTLVVQMNPRLHTLLSSAGGSFNLLDTAGALGSRIPPLFLLFFFFWKIFFFNLNTLGKKNHHHLTLDLWSRKPFLVPLVIPPRENRWW